MSVVIIGGHDRMVCQYKKICRQFNCKAKVFTQMSANLGKQIGSPDLIVLFTNTVSHKMVRCAVEEAGRCSADVVGEMQRRRRPLSYKQQECAGRDPRKRLCIKFGFANGNFWMDQRPKSAGRR